MGAGSTGVTIVATGLDQAVPVRFNFSFFLPFCFTRVCGNASLVLKRGKRSPPFSLPSWVSRVLIGATEGFNLVILAAHRSVSGPTHEYLAAKIFGRPR